MDAFTISVPAKIILFGEHAVVYGQPAVAIPVMDVRAKAVVEAHDANQPALIDLHNFNITYKLFDEPVPASITHVMEAIQYVQDCIQLPIPQHGWKLTIDSNIPVGRGMGSSAAISVLLLKALHQLMHASLPISQLIAHSFELEKYHHGTPSGVDNTVISIAKPIYFIKNQPYHIIQPGKYLFVIGDTGVSKKTGDVVAAVAGQYQQNRARYETIFNEIGDIVRDARHLLEVNHSARLGELMNRNQQLLREIQVSSPELEQLIDAALKAGAIGAKLCGAGQGGCMIAMAPDADGAKKIQSALSAAGAANSYITGLSREAA